MAETTCLKCGGEMDSGTVSESHGVKYLSDHQSGMFEALTRVRRARTCLMCGYIELYLDPEELKKRIGR